MGDFLLYTVGLPLTFLFLVLGMAMAARRILGLHVGLVRTTFACLLGVSLSEVALSAMPTPDTPALTTVQIGISLLLMIAVLTFAEIVCRPGPSRRPPNGGVRCADA